MAKDFWKHPGMATVFARDQRGVVALMFGLMVLPLFAAVGLAIDFGNVMAIRTKAQMAADAAVLQASGIARDIIKAGDGTEASTTRALADARTRAIALFNASAAQSKIKNYTFDIEMVRTGQTLSSTASFTVASDNVIGKVFGSDSFAAKGSAVSTSSLPIHSDVYLALDVSQSMGIAATKDEMIRLYNATITKTDGSTHQTSCVFGCHAVEANMAESNSAVAKRNGIRLRIDVLRDATKKMIQTAQQDAASAPIYKFALYTIGMNTAYNAGELKTLATRSGDFAALSQTADSINLGPSKGNGFSDSYLNEGVTALSGIVPASADGSDDEHPKTYAFIITDGVRDIQSNVNCVKTGNRCVSTLDPALCQTMKNNGVTVGVLYTTYERIDPIAPGTNWYNVQVVNTGVAANIASRLESCASPGWFFQASDATGIQNAMTKMFAQTTQAPTLTN